jgi:hypothetical protein
MSATATMTMNILMIIWCRACIGRAKYVSRENCQAKRPDSGLAKWELSSGKKAILNSTDGMMVPWITRPKMA